MVEIKEKEFNERKLKVIDIVAEAFGHFFGVLEGVWFLVMVYCTLKYLVLHFLNTENLECWALFCQSQLGCFSASQVKKGGSEDRKGYRVIKMESVQGVNAQEQRQR